MKDRPIKAGGEQCPCGTGLFRRVARCNESTDGLNLHYDICTNCGFETYAHSEMTVKVERYKKWKEKKKENKMRVSIEVPKSKIDEVLNEKLEELKEENKRLKSQIERVKNSVED